MRAGAMAKLTGLVLAAAALVISLQLAQASSPLTESDLKASGKLFKQQGDGSFGSLEETYFAVRAFEVISRGKPNLPAVCSWLSKKAGSLSSPADAAYAVKTAGILSCEDVGSLVKAAEPVLLKAAQDSKDLISLYLAITGLAFIQEKGLGGDGASYGPALAKVDEKLKPLIKPDGTWRYKVGQAPSSPKAAGLGLEIAAALVKLGALSGGFQVGPYKEALRQLFKLGVSPEGLPFQLPEGTGDESSGGGSPIATLSTAVKGALAFAAATGEPSEVADHILECATQLLDAVPNEPFEAYYQLVALDFLNNNPVIVPLVVEMPSQVCLLGDAQVKVVVTTVLGDAVPPIVVKTGKAPRYAECTKLSESTYLVAKADKLGNFAFPIKVESPDPKYVIPEDTMRSARVTAPISVTSVKLAVFDTDSTTPENEVNLSLEDAAAPASLSATHLQKLVLSLKLTGPDGKPFTPQQVFVKLSHDGSEHHFVPKSSGDTYTLKLDFLELMAKLYHISGDYSVELTVGDSLMENPFVWELAKVDLDLPAAPETAAKPPPPPTSLYARFGPQAEIQHVFRAPEKRPLPAVSYLFVVLAFLPLIGLLAGLNALGVNFKAFPSGGPAFAAATSFHAGLGAILLLYVYFWLQLNLFSTLKVLLLLAVMTAVPGHYALSHLANSSTKVKTL